MYQPRYKNLYMHEFIQFSKQSSEVALTIRLILQMRKLRSSELACLSHRARIRTPRRLS